MGYAEVTAFLFDNLPMYQKVGKVAYKPDLDTALAFDAYFKSPHRHYKSIHVAGTNGKGSVSHMLASVLQSAGYKVGLYTSPHLKDFRERIRVNGTPISEEEVVHFVSKHEAEIKALHPSFFEMASALAFEHFARQRVNIAVIETGMGGRLDATNIITPELSVITNIGMDHAEHLGDTLEAIAGEKAGIIKQEVPVLVGEWRRETAPVFERTARERHAALYYADHLLRVLHAEERGRLQHFSLVADGNLFPFEADIDLKGHYQQVNIVTALAAINLLSGRFSKIKRRMLSIPDDALAHGLSHVAAQTGLRGRWEIIGERPLVICDTGHNAHGFKETMPQLQSLAYRRLHFVFGVVQDKDIDSILPLLPVDAYYYFTQADLPRAMDARQLAERCIAYGLQGQVVQTVPNALKVARGNAFPDDVIFVGGSTFVVAEALP
ncbi:MAG: bifunctional folylpolyglutamate synthase/dihydrofolate synthase [Prevotellaceae bacterium]|jgi:dihydrofolate synthase/folylpolyglutamate synthase|nr:bifunctional folylpolyglutamate synthase/dihydrofolate synthase [Prevotellaceae bacterium]